jgi:lipoprotein
MRKTIIAFLLVALATLLTVGCSALVSVGHSNTNTINKTENEK